MLQKLKENRKPNENQPIQTVPQPTVSHKRKQLEEHTEDGEQTHTVSLKRKQLEHTEGELPLPPVSQKRKHLEEIEGGEITEEETKKPKH